MKLRSYLILFLAAAAGAKTVRIGVVAGHNQGMMNSVDLRYAESDAQKVAELFCEVGGLEPENLILLKSPRPEHLDMAFETARKKAAQAAPGDEVVFLFYFSGHGSRENLELGDKPYPLKDLKDRIESVPAKLRIGVFDACQSGAITRLKGARKVEPFMLEQKVKSNGSILLTSSADDENSQESDQVKGSFFTHHFLTALRGAGDVSGDKRVSLLEAWQYAYQRTLVNTENTRGGVQHPNAQFKMDVEGDVVLTDLNGGEGGLDFQPDLTGDVLVANEKADVLGEFHKEKGKASFLALPSGKYRVFLREGRKTRECKVGLRGGETKPVGAADLGSGFQLTGLIKGHDDPFDEDKEVGLPWKRANWSSQFPLQFAGGWFNDTYNYGSQIAIVSYKFLDPLSLVGSVVNTRDEWHFSAYTWKHMSLSIRMALQVSKFVSPDIEFLVSGGFRWHAYVRKGFLQDQYCSESGYCEQWAEYRSRYVAPMGPDIRFGGRIWLLNHLALEVTYGTEYNLGEKQFNSDFFYIAPSLHF